MIDRFSFEACSFSKDAVLPNKFLTASVKLNKIRRGHPLSTYAKFSEKLTFITPPPRVMGLEILVFQKILRTYLIDDT